MLFAAIDNSFDSILYVSLRLDIQHKNYICLNSTKSIPVYNL